MVTLTFQKMLMKTRSRRPAATAMVASTACLASGRIKKTWRTNQTIRQLLQAREQIVHGLPRSLARLEIFSSHPPVGCCSLQTMRRLKCVSSLITRKTPISSRPLLARRRRRLLVVVDRREAAEGTDQGEVDVDLNLASLLATTRQ